MGNQRTVVSGERTILTYAVLDEAADFALEQATTAEEGSFYNCFSSIVMSAFCLEAYVNHCWNESVPRLG